MHLQIGLETQAFSTAGAFKRKNIVRLKGRQDGRRENPALSLHKQTFKVRPLFSMILLKFPLSVTESSEAFPF